MFLMKLSTAATIEVGPVLDSAGAEYTGLVIGDLRLVKAGTGAAMAASATLTHVANGHYTLVFTSSNTDTLGTLTVSCHKSTYQMPRVLMQVIPVKVYDSIVAGSDNLEVDAIQLLGTAFANPTTAGLMDVNSKQFGGATVNATTSVTIPTSSTLATTAGAVGSVTAVSTGAITAASFAAGAIDASAIATDAIGSAEISAAAVTKIQSGLATPTNITAGTITTVTNLTNAATAGDLTATMKSSVTAAVPTVVQIQSGLATPTNITAGTITTVTNLTNAATSGDLTATMKSSVTAAVPTVSQTADQVWDELLSGHTTSGSTGAGLSAAGAAGDPWSTALPGSYGAGTAGKIVGDNLNATISSRASQTSLDTLDDLVDTEVAAIKTKTDQLTFTVANQIDANSLTIGANAITASALATDAVNEIQSGLATPTNITAITGNITGNLSGSVGSVTGNVGGNVTGSVASVVGNVGGSVASVAGAVGSVTGAVTVGTINADVVTASALAASAVNEIADQVWDELLSGHTGAGSTGAGLTSASSAGDPWSTALPGSYGAGTAGKILGDNVNATISSRASQTSLDTLDDLVDTEVAAIKTQTDKLTFTVANQVDSNSLSVSATGIRTAVGMNSANLDSQISGLATPTNITAATGIVLSPVTHTGARIPNVTLTDTATNLTNAATSGDLTATMKSSVTSAVPTAAQNFAAVLTTALTESYAADNTAPTLAQAIMLIQQSLHEFAINSTTRTVKKLDGSTTAATFTLDSATAPTSTTRAT